MTTAIDVSTREHRPELLLLIAAGANQLTTTWRTLATAQDGLLRRLERITSGAGNTPRVREAIAVFNGRVGAFDRDARALAERWAATDLPTAYRDGALRALATARTDTHLFAWTVNHQAALTALTAPFWADLIRRITEAVRRAQQFARAAADAARQWQGIDAADAARQWQGIDAAALLEQHPLDTVIYANQARHPVASWACSALIYQGVVTANTGAINVARYDLNTAWMECVDGPECGFVSHEDTDHADGTLRTVDEAAAYPIAHHGCIRQWVPRPDLAGRTDITSGSPA